MLNMRYKTASELQYAAYRFSVAVHSIVWGVLVLFVGMQVLLPALNNVSPFGIWNDNGVFTILDFPSIFNFTKFFWLDTLPPGISIYSVANHLRVTSAWAEQDISHSLSFGYSPTMLWLLAPLVHFSHATAYCIFNSFGLAAIWWETHPDRCRFGIGLLSFLNALTIGCFGQGQTALLTAVGLLFLFELSRNGFERTVTWRTVVAGVVLWALTAKPPLALTAGVVLLGLRQWRPVLLAALFALATTLAISPMLGPWWLVDYLHIITTHNGVQADPAFAFSHAPQHMANLRGLLSVDFNLPDDIASRFSSYVWLAALACLTAIGPRLRLATGGFWSIGVLLYLLFCPHVSSFEVLQAVLLVLFCIPATVKKLGWKEQTLLFIVLLLPFTTPIALDNRIILFSGLFFLLIFIALLWRKRPENCAVTS